ncbi:N-alpha-acetyltransferase 25, NatB auxiliary subunit [Acrasis kona]|uniref:N-alpha-acetyltransferase 25, NatB auxiliary subunit n=1 Tax=Acrasis kona TaxID=1008807 RepID=A0AAW2ZGN7_9EUKA
MCLYLTHFTEFRVGEWNGKSHPFRRGPFLAELELTHRTSASGEKIVIPSLLSTYFIKFCNKSIGYQDMKPYLVHATPTFLSQLVIPVQDPFQQIPYKINQRFVHLCIINLTRDRKMQRHLDQPLDVQQLIQEYKDALPFGSKLVKTENQHGDDFLLLAAHNMGSPSRVITFKCLLIRLYSVLGASGGQRIFQTFMTGLELKHIQWETLSHLIWNELGGAYGNYKKQKQVNDKILEFYFGEHLKDTPELTALPYRTGAYSKFKHRLDRSYQVHQSQIQMAYLELVRMRSKTILLQKLEDLNVQLKQYQKMDHVSDKLDSLLVQGDDAWTKLFESNKNVLNGSIQSAYTSVELLVNDAVENLKTNSE